MLHPSRSVLSLVVLQTVIAYTTLRDQSHSNRIEEALSSIVVLVQLQNRIESMHRYIFLALATGTFLTLPNMRVASAHCQVPCGVYGDQRRFEEMLEDVTTIAKAIAQINELAEKSDALSHNQLARWVATKESHASNIQKIIADYFMTQRIKSTSENYVKQLTAAHSVMVAAMKCKQTVDAASADSLKEAVLDLYRAYEGKEPKFDH